MPRSGEYPKPVLAVLFEEDADDFALGLDEFTAMADDAYWTRYVRVYPVSPQRFLNWWVARRWVVPRDVRRS